MLDAPRDLFELAMPWIGLIAAGIYFIFPFMVLGRLHDINETLRRIEASLDKRKDEPTGR